MPRLRMANIAAAADVRKYRRAVRLEAKGPGRLAFMIFLLETENGIGKSIRLIRRVRSDAGAQRSLARSLGSCRRHYARGIARVATPLPQAAGFRPSATTPAGREACGGRAAGLARR